MVNINATKDYQLSMEAVAGAGFAGDIAIDDISVMPGLCPPNNECDFEGLYYQTQSCAPDPWQRAVFLHSSL